MNPRSVSRQLRTSALLGAGLAGVVGSIVYGCSLGLDPSKIGATSGDAGLPPAADASPGDVVIAIEAGPDVDASDADADAPGCVLDTDCTSASACQVGACDAGTCSFTVCPTQTCQGSTCSATTTTCSPPKAYGFHATEVNVTAGDVGCGGNPSACLAAAYPFVFVGTTNGVVAYAVSDPSNPSPPAVSVLGVPFLPWFITSTGSRVYFVGWPEGSGPGYHLAIAWLDVPSDPRVTELEATTVFEVVGVDAIYAAWAATDGSLFLVEDDGTGTFPSADVAPPFVDGATITFFPSPAIPAGGSPVVPSGSRFVIARSQAQTTPYQTYFSFETGAGTQGAQNSGEQATFAVIGPTLPQSVYAQGSNGSSLWNAETVAFDDAGNTDVSGVRFSWLVADGGSTEFAQSGFVSPEQYSSPVGYGAPVAGPVAWVDPNTALVLAAAAETINTGTPQTSVQVAVMAGPALVSGKRYVVAQAPDQVGAAASGGFGYVLAAATGGTTTCTLHIFAPSCATSP